MIELDFREPVHVRKAIIPVFEDREIEVRESLLPRGDYFLHTKKRVVVERKVCDGDLLSSIANGRLQYQMRNLITEDIDVPILAIEGMPSLDFYGFVIRNDNTISKWQWTTICNMLMSIQREGILIHWVPATVFPEFLLSTYNYFMKKDHTSLRDAGKPFPSTLAETNYDLRKRILMGFPGIGDILAEKILATTDLATVINNPDILKDIEGISNTKLAKIKDILLNND